MELSFLQILLVFLAACISGAGSILDEWQTQRPIVACTLVGLALSVGAPDSAEVIKNAIIIGGTLELMALGWMNIGAAVAPDAALASVVSTILVIVGGQEIATGIAVAIPLAAAGQVLTYVVRAITVGFQHAADKSIEDGSLTRLDWLHRGALMLQVMRIAIPALVVALTAGTDVVQTMLNAIPPVVTTGLKIAGGFIAVVGYAMVINMMRAGHLMPFFFAGFVIAGFTDFNLVALGALGAIMALLYIQLHPKYNKSQQVVVAQAADNGLDNRLD
ncbi:PTS mannose/fructose/sorbose transporter subunit IIC [Actinobacillus equuli subsp. equuli]|uniref:PTS system mannose-specific transporter subunit IIC n=1 Tax=Actinobacillus equuli TaxID=718 RepID=A0AAX3FL40_ACTEU|nr:MULTISPECIES: PTS mannose/fructose/sorbose transporter subunit IIC [Actinobacillus]AIZ80259.1 PTS mannose transporter subunit IIC [Actinobacillus equuli subsp. equuli]WGE44365.1 PTS mannose/fructose/sorbose transporter subunit IIC [Actinobacillus equuli subsp. equuli]WGE54999.1 PTS mannose/fructose/sorbose transporter subunit IIC [Actinobacillus equuli subsp. equuli]WGE63133.1 PTS mannose/fructose/sorbose transporter subunit IIC [Actinobacillus equuli subsp. haemolyticus]WGE71429.1 PTS mann